MEEGTLPKPFVFVLMPFTSEFNDVYHGIKEGCDRAGAYCERLDDQIFEESMLDRIYNQILKSDCIIADMTGRNPNVFYEVGYAHALGKRVILITKDASDIPFDLKHHYHLEYGSSLFRLRDELSKRVKWYIENPEFSRSLEDFEAKIFLNDKKLSKGKVISVTPKYKKSSDVDNLLPQGKYIHVVVSAYHPAERCLDPFSLKLQIITPAIFSKCVVRQEENSTAYSSINMPDGKIVHKSLKPIKVAPGEWDRIDFYIFPINEIYDEQVFDFHLIIITGGPSIDFPFKLKIDESFN